jgi:hypothetical protein
MNNFDDLFDFIVVGSGGGSMCAALLMRANGKSQDRIVQFPDHQIFVLSRWPGSLGAPETLAGTYSWGQDTVLQMLGAVPSVEFIIVSRSRVGQCEL